MTAREGQSTPIARAVTSSVQNHRCGRENCPSAKRRGLAIFNRELSRPGTISTELSVQDWSRALRRRLESQARPSCRPCRSATIAQGPRLHISDPGGMWLDQPLVAALAVPAHPHSHSFRLDPLRRRRKVGDHIPRRNTESTLHITHDANALRPPIQSRAAESVPPVS
jgi:hypothetical protein